MMGYLVCLCSLLLVAASVTADTCPGGKVRCPDFYTCCSITDEEFGCCPFPEAKCCSDRIHCCPHNMECDIPHQSCISKGSSVKFLWQVPIHPEIVEPVPHEVRTDDTKEINHLRQFLENENKCPDESMCHSAFTCCKMYSGKYGCCPFDHATCCTDGFHCCPHGSQCTASGSCYSAEMNFTIGAYPLKDKKYDKQMSYEKKQRKSSQVEISDPNGKCPDGHPCPEKYTCCKISGERYGCCPYTEARCCDDGIHCCPKGTNCNTTLGTCDVQKNFGWSFPSQSLVKLQWSEAPDKFETSSFVEEVIVTDVVCPDERYHCPSRTTCCQLASGAYGCCPLEKAVCCTDHEHCCPHDFECVAGGCVKGGHHLPPFLQAVAASEKSQVKGIEDTDLSVSEHISGVICPDQYECPDHSTCCELESGDYGCCPLEKATCCEDKVHCCPHGYRCIEGGCRKNSGSSWILPQFLSAVSVKRDHKHHAKIGNGVICPDLQSECPDGNTCCQLATGDYGCCPYEDATCCGDMEHCCPHGYWCSDEGCERASGTPRHLPAFLHKLSSATKLIPSP